LQLFNNSYDYSFLFVLLLVVNHMNRTLRALGLGFTAAISLQLQAQDPELSQFYASPVYTNPALAGSAVCSYGAAGRLALNYRNQWPNLPGTFRSFAASWDQHIPAVGGGLGAMVFHDIAGTGLLSTTSVSGVYSYLLQLDRRQRMFMRFGLQGSLVNKSLDWSKLRFSDQIDPTQGFVNATGEQPPSLTKTYSNFNAGWIMYTQKFYIGFAAHNITEPGWSFFENPDEVHPRRFTVHTGGVIPLSRSRFEQNNFSPNMLFMKQRNFTQMNLGFYANKGPLVTGLWFRQTFGQQKNPDAIIMLVGFRKDRFKFGYSYDFTVSDGRTAIPSSHEISATIDWCVPPGRHPFKPLRCPEF
jgi:type IX secretion system PorP/SprF family membrane protein